MLNLGDILAFFFLIPRQLVFQIGRKTACLYQVLYSTDQEQVFLEGHLEHQTRKWKGRMLTMQWWMQKGYVIMWEPWRKLIDSWGENRCCEAKGTSCYFCMILSAHLSLGSMGASSRKPRGTSGGELPVTNGWVQWTVECELRDLTSQKVYALVFILVKLCDLYVNILDHAAPQNQFMNLLLLIQ